MASLRSCFLRFMIQHIVGPKFKRAGSSVSELRKLDELSFPKTRYLLIHGDLRASPSRA